MLLVFTGGGMGNGAVGGPGWTRVYLGCRILIARSPDARPGTVEWQSVSQITPVSTMVSLSRYTAVGPPCSPFANLLKKPKPKYYKGNRIEREKNTDVVRPGFCTSSHLGCYAGWYLAPELRCAAAPGLTSVHSPLFAWNFAFHTCQKVEESFWRSVGCTDTFFHDLIYVWYHNC